MNIDDDRKVVGETTEIEFEEVHKVAQLAIDKTKCELCLGKGHLVNKCGTLLALDDHFSINAQLKQGYLKYKLGKIKANKEKYKSQIEERNKRAQFVKINLTKKLKETSQKISNLKQYIQKYKQ